MRSRHETGKTEAEIEEEFEQKKAGLASQFAGPAFQYRKDFH